MHANHLPNVKQKVKYHFKHHSIQIWATVKILGTIKIWATKISATKKCKNIFENARNFTYKFPATKRYPMLFSETKNLKMISDFIQKVRDHGSCGEDGQIQPQFLQQSAFEFLEVKVKPSQWKHQYLLNLTYWHLPLDTMSTSL